jgi:hypothetical protein
MADSSMGISEDKFVRVMGGGATNSQVKNPNEFGIISTSMMPDGSYVVFYDSDLGVKAIFSNDNGINWHTSSLIFARFSRNGLLIGNNFFYISSANEIILKYTEITDFYDARNISLMLAGEDRVAAELNLQRILDEKDYIAIGSGPVEPQRLSGYISPEGTIKLFFYDQNNLIKCMESLDSYEWKVTNNF